MSVLQKNMEILPTLNINTEVLPSESVESQKVNNLHKNNVINNEDKPIPYLTVNDNNRKIIKLVYHKRSEEITKIRKNSTNPIKSSLLYNYILNSFGKTK